MVVKNEKKGAFKMFSYDNYYSDKIYNVGMYLRLSKEDETAGQSESIENQKKIITNYVLEHNWNIIDIYIDDGFSGLNFKRPAFEKMIKDIEAKKINLVITKDLSRLGRDYIDTGYYLERYFPTKNVRYIAINDGIDTYVDNGNNDISPFKSVINDMYAKDISKKIRAVMDTKRINGEFIGAFAPYGYLKSPDNKNNFVVDETASKVVKRIFDMYVSGNSMGRIVRILNNECVPCPAKYKLTNSTYKNSMVKRYKWCQETIKRILTNPTYMGCMTQKRQEKISYKIDRFKKIPQSNWIIVEDTHQAIISPETFALVQEMIVRKTVCYSRGEDSFHLLNGLVFCKECGAKMTYRRNSSGKMVMNCMTYSKFGPSECSSHNIHEEELNQYVINDLKRISNLVLDEDFFNSLNELNIEKSEDDTKQKLIQIDNRFSEIRDIIKTLYEDKVKGIISEKDFLEMTQEYSDEKETLNRQKVQLNQKTEEQPKEYNYIDIFKSIADFDTIDKAVLTRLIDRIEISNDKEITIYYLFNSPK